ncbi:MAG: hypothetical protein ACPH4O_03940 [Flavobacteriaceae bacterium]
MKTIILILSLFLSLGCNNNDPQTPFQPSELNFTEIGKGELFTSYQNNDNGINLVIDNLTEWNNLINTIDNPNNVSANFTETNIDFSNFQVIAVFDKAYINGGWSIDITSIIENENNLTVNIDNLQSGDLTQISIQPFHIVKIPVTNKPIEFE